MMIGTSRYIAIMAVVLVAVLGGCKKKPPPAPPGPKVTVAVPTIQTVTRYYEFTARTQAVATVELRARVKGFLQSVNFRDGAVVKKGDLLFVIEPEQYQAAVDQAQGRLENCQAKYRDEKFNYGQYKKSYEKKVATITELMNAKTAYETSKANVDSAKADLENAKINLSYTHVYAPVDGKMSRHMVDIGNLVGDGSATLLGTIVTQKPIYAYFYISEPQWLSAAAHAEQQKIKLIKEGKPLESEKKYPVSLRVSDEENFPHKGHLDYLSNQVQSSTGTIQTRGIWPNEDGKLIPGMFARVRIPISHDENAMTVPEAALGRNQFGAFLLVVNDKNIVEQRRVKIGPVEKGMREITSGITAKDHVIIDGLQRARPGNPVTPELKQPQPPASGNDKNPTTNPTTKPA